MLNIHNLAVVSGSNTTAWSSTNIILTILRPAVVLAIQPDKPDFARQPKNPLEVTIFGKPSLSGLARCAAWVGRFCYENPANGRLSNHWITLHETGNVAGFNPVLVMDVWEHAFILDYKPADRPKYIEAFFANIDWGTVERRLHRMMARPVGV